MKTIGSTILANGQLQVPLPAPRLGRLPVPELDTVERMAAASRMVLEAILRDLNDAFTHRH